MRTLAEERGSGTIETLLTAPVTDAQVVVAKFLGCWIFYLAMLAPTLLYVAALASFGSPDYGSILAGYLGLVLLGAMYVAVENLLHELSKPK
jgi:ABC-2 type transport system permease protein